MLDVDLFLGWRVKRQFCVGRRSVVGLAGQTAVLCWTSTCCWVGGSSGSFVLDVDLLLGWRVKRQFCVGRRPVVGLAGQAPERWAAGRPVVRCPAGPDHQGQTDGQIGGL